MNKKCMNRIISQSFAICLMTICLNACSSDDEATIGFPTGSDTQRTIDCEENVGDLSIVANGKWSASIEPANTNWLSLVQETGENDATISYVVSPNTTAQARTASIVLTAGSQKVAYKVTQTIAGSLNDENAEVDCSKFNGSIPLGYGMNISNESGTMLLFNKSQIFRLKTIQKKIDDFNDLDLDDYVSVVDLPVSKAEVKTEKDFRDEESNMGATLSVSVGYGKFKLELKGAFKLASSTKDTSFVYRAISEVPVAIYALDYSKLQSAYDDEEKVQDSYKKYVIDNHFAILHDSIESLAQSQADPKKLDDQIKDLIDTYGAVFCSGAQVGGTANLSVTFDSKIGSDSTKINGSLKAGFDSAFKLEAEVTANYLQTGAFNIEGCKLVAETLGGTDSARESMIDSLVSLVNPNIDTKSLCNKLIGSINTWRKSIDETKPKTYTCTHYQLEGIWMLFKSNEAKTAIKKYVQQAFPNKIDKDGNESSPYLVDIQKMVK